MQTLTIPASITKRKQACRSCRQRKKKCDADHPECGYCKKLGIRCEYTVPASCHEPITGLQNPETFFQIQSSIFPFSHIGQNQNLDFIQCPEAPFDFLPHPELSCPPIGYLTPESRQDASSKTDSLDIEQDLLASLQLPDDELLIELVTLFFEHKYHIFPCFHKQGFLKDLATGQLQKDAALLLYAICCLASKHHSDPVVRARQSEWYGQAKFAYNLTRRAPEHGIRVIQAVILLVYHAFTIGDFSSSWLFVGKAWRQAVTLGLNRMDASALIRITGQGSAADAERLFDFDIYRGKTIVEKEEYRRTLWLLFIVDRNLTCPTGWGNAIPEPQFKVDFPIADTIFQSLDSDLDTSPYTNAPFTPKFNRLVASSSSAREPLNMLHYIGIAHVLLGRISELIYSLHDQPDTPEYAEDCEEMDAMLVKFRLSLPRQATSVLEAPPTERGLVVWLSLALNNMAILLHYRCADGVPVADAASRLSLAVAAAQSTAQTVKDAARFSTDLLMSAHIGSSLYIAACVLVIQWRKSGDDSIKEDIDLFALLFERMNEEFEFLGLKFVIALEYDLKRSAEDISSLRDRGFRGLLADCSKWGYMKEEVQRRGINLDIT